MHFPIGKPIIERQNYIQYWILKLLFHIFAFIWDFHFKMEESISYQKRDIAWLQKCKWDIQSPWNFEEFENKFSETIQISG